ncbi:hypothetical protein C8Q72DRAFT_831252 [Fomitopsis betulina]|nr:hypothetical protein C8Q72DRAFT_831252 [Fomitopsis betulina]
MSVYRFSSHSTSVSHVYMSSDGDLAAELAYVAYNLELGYIQNYCMVATAALVLYEHACTLSQEADVIWSRKKTGATLLFLLNRFATAGFALAMMLLIPNWDTLLACRTVNLLLPAFQLMLSFIWAAFSALRVFAISGRDWRMSGFVFALSLVPVGTNLVSDIRQTYDLLQIPFFTVVCDYTSLISEKTSISLLITTRTCLIAADLLVLVVTWRHTYRLNKEARAISLKTPMVTLLLRDGTIYFTLLLVLNVLHLALEITDVFWDITYFVTGFSSIIVSRFLLNLRQVGAAESGAGADSGVGSRPSFVASHPSRLVFASVVLGNLGEQLDLPYGEPLSGSEDLDLDMDFSDTCGGSAEHGTILESGIGR